MLTGAQRATYDRDGFIVVRDVFSAEDIAELRRVTDEFVAASATVTANDAIYDLEDTHSADEPRVRRLKAPHAIHPVCMRASRHPKIVELLTDLWGSLRFDTGKLNMKSAGYGAPIEWHQDWALYPHTNEDLAGVGIMIDDVEGNAVVVSYKRD
jgi:phytanoyl-CoA hydroxylase